MNEFDRFFERFWNDLSAQRIVLAFTVGMFLSCSAELAAGQALDRSTRPSPSAAKLEAAFGTALAKSGIMKGLPLAFETVPQIAGGAATILLENLPLNYYETLGPAVENVTVADAMAAASKYLDSARLSIAIVGDRKVIEPRLQAARLAPIVIVDDQGRPVVR